MRAQAARWTWDPIPWADQQKAADRRGQRLVHLLADPERDLVFVPTGSASARLLRRHAARRQQNANSVVALKASTGQLVWAFQVVHHDLWDYDVAAAARCSSISVGSRRSRSPPRWGSLFVLDRVTGKPLDPVEERPVPRERHARGGGIAHPALSRLGSALVPQSIDRGRRWEALRPRRRAWCRETGGGATERRHVHSAEPPGEHRLSRGTLEA